MRVRSRPHVKHSPACSRCCIAPRRHSRCRPGCVIFELCTGTPLFNWRNEREKYMQLARVYDEGWGPPRLPPHAATWQEVVDALLCVDPVKRALPADILQMEVFGCGPDVAFAASQGPRSSSTGTGWRRSNSAEARLQAAAERVA